MAQPYCGSEPYCFVSYSHKDKDMAMRWLDALEVQGFRLWFDEGIDPGTEWAEEIAAHLENASAYLVLLSPSAVESVYVRSEISRAIELRKDILCIYLRPCALSGGLKLQLGIYRAVHAYQYEDPRRAQDLVFSTLPDALRRPSAAESEPVQPPQSPAQSSPSRRSALRTGALMGVGLLAAVILVFLLWRRQPEPPEPVDIPTETPTPTETPAPTLAPTPQAEPAEEPVQEEQPPLTTPEPALLTDISEVNTDAAVEQLSAIMNEVIAENVQTSWSEPEHLVKSEYVGFYLLISTNGNELMHNRLIVVFRNEVSIVLPDENVNKRLSYYYTLTFVNVRLDENGALILETPEKPTSRVNAEIPGHDFFYAGYKSRADVYYALVTPYRGTCQEFRVGDLS